jgi:hypothetical protein
MAGFGLDTTVSAITCEAESAYAFDVGVKWQILWQTWITRLGGLFYHSDWITPNGRIDEQF